MSTFALRPRGVGLMVSLELRQRVRSVRWYVAIGIWAVFLVGMNLLVFGAALLFTGSGSSAVFDLPTIANLAFSLSVLMLVATMLLVLPALSAGSINGDRNAGTLATLQATLLSPLEIVVGKILAGWAIGLVFLAAALPSILPAALLGLVPPLYVLRVLFVIALLMLLITAVGVGLSALTNRQLGSVVLAYVLVLGTAGILPVVFVVTAVTLTFEREVTVYRTEYIGQDYDSPRCVEQREEMLVPGSDLAMPLLWANPVVIVADQAPPVVSDLNSPDSRHAADMLRLIRTGLRYAAQPAHPSVYTSCWDQSMPGYPEDLGTPTGMPVWPMGLGIWMVVGAGATLFAVLRIRTPMRRLPRGTRIA
ncbi:MAG: ABC transporter permease [Brachybacterium sp.]|nr:ABC transporter permease [Brachybacterium sp.]